jgi:exodeoxyribonuclease VII large subunit
MMHRVIFLLACSFPDLNVKAGLLELLWKFIKTFGKIQTFNEERLNDLRLQYLTVTELTGALKRLIEEQFVIDGIWVKGEISNFTNHSSGHLYFTLKDANARISCVMFKSQARLLTFKPENGQAVSVRGRISIYEKNGNYQLYVVQMENDGLGGLFQAFEKLKQQLAGEGLFDPERKRPLPKLPQQIGLITSPTGAAICDLVKILKRRRPKLDILIFPAQVQGKEAPLSLVKALQEAARFPKLDLVIIGRGGGSLEELWAFNDEKVARAIAGFPKPVIAAVGHETDFTIADFVADLRAPTPSAAAELAVPDEGLLTRNLAVLQQRLVSVVQRKLQNERRVLQKISSSRVLLQPQAAVEERRQDLDLLTERLTRQFHHDLQRKRERFDSLIGALNTLSPLATLHRGYAIAQKSDGTVLKASGQVEVGESLQLRLASGSLGCEVKVKE